MYQASWKLEKLKIQILCSKKKRENVLLISVLRPEISISFEKKNGKISGSGLTFKKNTKNTKKMHTILFISILFLVSVVSGTEELNCTLVTQNYPLPLLDGTCSFSESDPFSFLMNVTIMIPSFTQNVWVQFLFLSKDKSEIYYSSNNIYSNPSLGYLNVTPKYDVLSCYAPSLVEGEGSFSFLVNISNTPTCTLGNTCDFEEMALTETSYELGE